MQPKCGMWHIQGTVIEKTSTGQIAHQIPTFYIHPEVQGCDNAECAERVAKRIIGLGRWHEVQVYVFATLVSVESVVED